MAMARILLVIGAIVMLWHSGECVNHKNDFDAISGCLQYDNVPGYNDPQLYFPTSRFRNMVRTPHSRILRMGIVGVKDANFRYGRSAFPATGEQVVEIVLGGWDNTKSAGRLQVRRWNIENTLLKDAETPRIMSGSRPLVFKMEVFDNGLVELTKDGENRPFFAFTNPQKSITVDYIAFTKWEMDMIYFYDCPL